jgi:hypothetical protein
MIQIFYFNFLYKFINYNIKYLKLKYLGIL